MTARSCDIRRVPAPAIIDLRHRVLRQGLPIESAHFEGDDDSDTVHLAAFNSDGKIVGCATVLLRPWENQRACQLRGMAVDFNAQRSGIGKQILAAACETAKEKGATLLWANCRQVAVDFYQKTGWQLASEEFEIPTAGPHFKMIRRLS